MTRSDNLAGNATIQWALQDILMPVLLFLTIIGLTFVGDFALGQFPAYFIFVPMILILRIILSIALTWSEMISIFLGTTFVTSIFLANSMDASFYYYGFAFMVIYVLMLPVIVSCLDYRFTTVLVALVIMGLAALAARDIVTNVARASYVFGPNVYYRIIGVLGTLFLLSNYRTHQFKWITPIVLLMAIIALAATGSRGSIPIMFFLIALFYWDTLRSRELGFLRRPLLLPALLILLVIIRYAAYIYERFWRLFYFTTENASLTVRQNFVTDFTVYLSDATILELIFGTGPFNKTFGYHPHNIYMEAIVYHGVFFVTLSFVFLGLLFSSLLKRPESRRPINVLVLIFTPIYLGSLFSGSLLEAYPIYSTALLFVGTILQKAMRVPPFPQMRRQGERRMDSKRWGGRPPAASNVPR